MRIHHVNSMQGLSSASDCKESFEGNVFPGQSCDFSPLASGNVHDARPASDSASDEASACGAMAPLAASLTASSLSAAAPCEASVEAATSVSSAKPCLSEVSGVSAVEGFAASEVSATCDLAAVPRDFAPASSLEDLAVSEASAVPESSIALTASPASIAQPDPAERAAPGRFCKVPSPEAASASEKVPVVFGGLTALQIVRIARLHAVDFPVAEMTSLPVRAPFCSDVLAAIERIEARFPGFRLDRPVHVLVGGSARLRASKLCVSHTCKLQLSGPSFLDVGEGVFVSAPGLAFVQVGALEESQVELLQLGFEVCGTYLTPRTIGRLSRAPRLYQVSSLSSKRTLLNYAKLNSGMNGARKVMRAAPYFADGSASPRETQLALALGLPNRFGGGGLGMPEMNFEVRANDKARALAGRSSFRCDLCWPKAKLDVEYQSREMHEGEASRIRDSRRANALALMGWTVVGVTNDELDSVESTDAIIHLLGNHLGKDLRVRVADYPARKLALRRQLGLPVGHDEWL